MAEGQPLAHVAHLLHAAPHRIRAWRTHFLARRRPGLVDAPRPGQPPKLSPAALALLEEALTKSPQAYGFLSTVWTVRALGALLAYRHGVEVYTAAVRRTLLAQGYRYRQPRHDLKHRQDPQAVAAARQVLEWLKKKSAPAPGGVQLVYVDECEVLW